MSKQNYEPLAEAVIAAVGGPENITSVTHCMTRLRFVLKDDSIPNADQVKKIKGVKGVMNQGGQYQVIIGTHVNEVCPIVQKKLHLTDGQPPAENKDTSLFNRFFKVISGCMMPMIGPMIAGGILKGLLTILVTAGVLNNTTGTYQILYAAADAVLYFMPIIVGFSAGKVFNTNPYVTAAIGAALVYPNLAAAIASEEGIAFLGVPVVSMSYANSFLPILVASYFASWVEKGAKKIIPQMVQLMIVPAVVLLVTVPASFLVIGPVMNTVSNWMSAGVMFIYNLSPIFGGLLLGAFWQVIVLLGLHAAFIPVLINNLMSMGSDPINAILGITVWAIAGMALGYGLKQKDPEQKSIGIGSFLTAMCGVTEPAIYSIALPNMKLFACSWIGGGIGGAILAMLGGRIYAMAGDGLFRIPAMINPAGLDISFYGFIGCASLALVVSAVLGFFMAKREEAVETENAFIQPIKGEVVDQALIPDQIFASDALGKGYGIKPAEGIVYAPFSGTIATVANTKHSVGLVANNGLELLIHVGIDTVHLNGKGFDMKVAANQKVKQGDILFTFDKDQLEKDGYDLITAVLVMNADDHPEYKEQLNLKTV
ncbi:glucose PTS transporter subunit IIA [uncultured Dubosiella sp.]|uniref:glucose PTS transporter subunit IIA n=1 Tax=uncultured Dubosiella sp. TaxID=1937011 RepID=UPI0025B5E8EC|nr:glucose PTS transporter subunit IIA [uncultured Dubosiella sp.]